MDYLMTPKVVTGVVFIGLVAIPKARTVVQRLIKHMMPTLAPEEVSTLRVREMARRLRGLDVLEMNEHEQVIARDIIAYEDIREDFSSIGGLCDIIEELKMAVIYPVARPELRLSPSRGIFLYGPPGTGKTLVAKAMAKEADVMFINLNKATILSRYLGESQKLVAAAFSLAEKLQPAIIFVDEVDGLLSQRHNGDNEAMNNLKGLFLALMVTILGATNHRDQLDDAILRRFADQLHIPLPDVDQRESILKVNLRNGRRDRTQVRQKKASRPNRQIVKVVTTTVLGSCAVLVRFWSFAFKRALCFTLWGSVLTLAISCFIDISLESQQGKMDFWVKLKDGRLVFCLMENLVPPMLNNLLQLNSHTAPIQASMVTI
eukprot:SM000236S08014  [mRNA]  locus=s236:84140:93764:- [translate_table: standard]